MGRAARRILRNAAIVGALLTAGSYPLFGRPDVTLAVALGAAAMAVNFWLLATVIRSMLDPATRVSKGKLALRLVLKISFLFGVLALLIYGPRLEPLALLAGVSAVVVAIFLEGVLPTLEEEPTEPGE